jgi:cytosine/adenosine deaminase-related metal-dependent hydrolase
MTTLIENVCLIFGGELQVINNGCIEIDNGKITFAGEGRPPSSPQDSRTVLNGHGLLAIPGLIDAHTHLADSVAKDVGIGSSLDALVHPIHGMKTMLLKEAPEAQVCEAMAATARDMLASGITTFADFREGGLAGVQLAQKALRGTKQRALILGRPNFHFNEGQVVDESRLLTQETMQELVQTLEICSGLGVSGANEYTGNAMKQISEVAKGKGKLLGVHASESAESRKFSLENFSSSEVERVLHYLKPDFLVHFTNSTAEDLQKISEKRIRVICCPRANSILGLGVPPIPELCEAGVTVALGTDNVMLNAPDMFREMDYTSRTLRANQRYARAIASKEILKMATVNAANALGLDSEIGSIEKGKRADMAFLDLNSANLRFSRDFIASVVHRARPEDVKCVMLDGEVVHGSIPSV